MRQSVLQRRRRVPRPPLLLHCFRKELQAKLLCRSAGRLTRFSAGAGSCVRPGLTAAQPSGTSSGVSVVFGAVSSLSAGYTTSTVTAEVKNCTGCQGAST